MGGLGGTLSVHVSLCQVQTGHLMSLTHTDTLGQSKLASEQLSFSQCLTVIGDSPALKAHMVPQNSCGTGRP